MMGVVEYRAVFSNLQNQIIYGNVYTSLKDALNDHDPRSEETLSYMIGVETRKLVPWTHVSINEIVQEKK